MSNISIKWTKKGPVAKYIKKTSLTPTYKKLSDYVITKDAIKLEQRYIKDYIDKGWNVLNSNKGGAVGGNKVIWTKQACNKIAKMFDKKLDFFFQELE